MKNIKKFIKMNRIISIFFVISLFVIFSYIATMDLPELFEGAEQWYNLSFQLSIGYIINFIFYITQVYVPNIQKEAKVNKCISVRINHIISHMKSTFSQLALNYIPDHHGDIYTEDELKQLLKLNFNDSVHVVNATKSSPGNAIYFTVREWIELCIQDTESDIDKLYKYYSTYISASLMEVLEQVLHSNYHEIMKMFLRTPHEVHFSSRSPDIYFLRYYQLMCELEKIRNEEYN